MAVGADPPTNIMAVQNGFGSVQVSWTAPSPPPFLGYRVTVDQGGVSVAAPSSPHTIALQPGVYSIHVTSFPQDLSSEALAVEVTVRGEGIAKHKEGEQKDCAHTTADITMQLLLCRYLSTNYNYIITGSYISHCILDSASIQFHSS